MLSNIQTSMDSLKQTLIDQKPVILQKWLESILETYPTDAATFMQNQKDRFHNPVGQTFSTETEAIHRERQLKGWSRAKKQALIIGDTERLRMLSQKRDQKA